jgi:CBS domain-containing membrane protein
VKNTLSKLIRPEADISHRSILAAVVGVFVAIAMVVLISRQFLGGLGLPLLVASMGASGVILFAMPTSPMAKSWSVIGGHFVSVIVGVWSYQHLADLLWASAFAVAMSMAFMFYLRCLHPPGGAAALVCIVGGPEIHELGYRFVFTPVMMNVMIILLVAMTFEVIRERFATKPLPDDWWEAVPSNRRSHQVTFTDNDVTQVLKQLDTFIDVNREDLAKIYSLSMLHAQTRHLHDKTCRDIMTNQLIKVDFDTALEEAWRLMKLHGIRALPVVNRANHVIGIVTVSDFLMHAQAMGEGSEKERLQRLITPTDGLTSDKPEVAGQIMTSQVHTLRMGDKILQAIELFRQHNIHHVPIVDDRDKLVGIISSSDLYYQVEDNKHVAYVN